MPGPDAIDPSSRYRVRLGTRASPLALAQAELVADALAQATRGEVASELVTFTTTGDRILDRPLTEAGGKGLFTKELDQAQVDGAIDIAVHSLKDMAVKLEPGLMLAAFLPREDPRDCLVGPAARLSDLPEGALLGTSSLRRKAQALAVRPDLRVVGFRGNVQTRLRKLAEGEAHATLLAAAGLSRLGMMDKAAGVLSIEEMIPAASQGIIGITAREDAPDWLCAALAAIDDWSARLSAAAERSFLSVLDGSCRTPIAAHLHLGESGATLTGEVLLEDGAKRWRAEARIEGRLSEQDAIDLGLAVGEEVAALRADDGHAPVEPANGDEA